MGSFPLMASKRKEGYMQWEYAGEEMVITTYLQNPMERCVEAFNKLGEEGWELVSTVSTFDPERNMDRAFGVLRHCDDRKQRHERKNDE